MEVSSLTDNVDVLLGGASLPGQLRLHVAVLLRGRDLLVHVLEETLE